MNFAQPELVQKYGTWVKVQVAFYDFLLSKACRMTPEQWNSMAINEHIEGIADGQDFFESQVAAVAGLWDTPEEAWSDFLKEQ